MLRAQCDHILGLREREHSLLPNSKEERWEEGGGAEKAWLRYSKTKTK